MTWLTELLDRFTQAFQWFFILQPWEQALRVRAGKKIRKYEGGIHFKVPYIDFIFKQNTRFRVSAVPAQNVDTLDGNAMTISGSLGYRVVDLTPLYILLHTADETLGQKVQRCVCEYIEARNREDITPTDMMECVTEKLKFGQYGLEDVEFIVTDMVQVKTLRLIMGDLDKYTEFALQTNEADE